MICSSTQLEELIVIMIIGKWERMCFARKFASRRHKKLEIEATSTYVRCQYLSSGQRSTFDFCIEDVSLSPLLSEDHSYFSWFHVSLLLFVVSLFRAL